MVEFFLKNCEIRQSLYFEDGQFATEVPDEQLILLTSQCSYRAICHLYELILFFVFVKD